jgi:GH24 family phage-related lysozyme (muramidase)
MGLFSKRSPNEGNVGAGDTSTGGLPKRINKADRQKAIDETRRAEEVGGFSVGGRDNARPDGWQAGGRE